MKEILMANLIHEIEWIRDYEFHLVNLLLTFIIDFLSFIPILQGFFFDGLVDHLILEVYIFE